MEPLESKRINVVHERIPSDNYKTPLEIAKWTVDRCMEISEKYCGKSATKLRMLEPGCGDAQPFSRYAASQGISSFGVDIREVDINGAGNVTVLKGESFLDMPGEGTAILYSQKYDIIATNPPFIYGIEFVNRAMDLLSPRGVAAFLLKLSFMSSQSRLEFFEQRPPSEVHILSKRPSFAHGRTDRGQEYGIFVWNGEEVDKKIRAKRGRLTRVFWQRNKDWEIPLLADQDGDRVVVTK